MVGIFNLLSASGSLLLVSQVAFANPSTSSSILLPRQFSGLDPNNVPTDCIENQCGKYGESIQACTSSPDLKCICENSNVQLMRGCLQCALDANISTFNATYANEALNSFVNACKASGFNVDGGGTLSSDSSSKSNSGSSGSTNSSSSSSSSSGNDSKNNKAQTVTGTGVGVIAMFTLALSVFTLG